MKNSTFRFAILFIFVLGIVLRLIFSPDINFESDSFSLLLSAKNIYENGQYSIPPVALTDNVDHPRYTGWAVGYPLLLSAIFSIFGYGETIARLLTILLSSVTILMVAILGNRLYGKKMGIVSALLVAVNPTLVCINGRILSANIAYAFLTMSISFAFLAAIRETGDKVFLSLNEILTSRKHRSFVYLSSFFFGCTLATRDDYSIFAPVLAFVVLGVMYNSREGLGNIKPWDYVKCSVTAIVLLVVGYLPNTYFNYQNYGQLFASTGLEYGLRLSLDYFLSGNDALYHLSGWIIITATLLILVAPIFSILFLWKSQRSMLIGIVTGLMLLAIIFVYGSFPTSIGGSGRYIVPIIPFALISAGMLLVKKDLVSQWTRSAFIVCLILWNILLFYPPRVVFDMFPKTAHITHYIPWYNTDNYMNYPHPIVTTVKWVKGNTPPNAIILSDYDNYHYFFYANRDVVNPDSIEEIRKYLAARPMFFVEDHQRVINRTTLGKWMKRLGDSGITLMEKGSIPFFSPSAGRVSLKIFELSLSTHGMAQIN